MADVQAGSAYVPIRPDMRNFHTTIQAELQRVLGPIVDRIGKQIGRDLGDGIGDGLGDPLDKPLKESSRRQKQQAPRDGDAVAGAFADGFQRRLKAALAKLPKATITAESSEAEARVEALRASLEELSSKKIGVDISADAALAQLDIIRAELDRLDHEGTPIEVRVNAGAALAQLDVIRDEVDRLDGRTASAQVDVDAGKADAELAATNAEVDRLDGRTARIGADADVGGAIAKLFGLQSTLLGLGAAAGPALVPIGAGLLGLAGPLAGAGAGFGALALVAIPALTRIKAAVDAKSKSDQAAGASAIQAQQQDLARVGAEEELANAVRAQAAAHTQALEQERTAQQGLTQAQIAAADAERALFAARQQAVRSEEDMRNQIVSTGLAIEAQRLAVDDAKAGWQQAADAAQAAAATTASAQAQLDAALGNQAKVTQTPGDSGAAAAAQAQVDAAKGAVTAAQAAQAAQERAAQKAKIQFEQAQEQLKEQQLQLRRLKEDEAAAAKAGVDGSDEVRSARERLAQATLQVANAERALKAARAGIAASDLQAAQQVAAAHRAVTAAALSAAASNAGLADSMSALSPLEAQVAAGWTHLQGAFNLWAASLQPAVLPLFLQGMHLLQGLLPLLTPIVRGAAGAVHELITEIATTISSPFWTSFWRFLAQEAGPAILQLGQLVLHLAPGIAALIQAFAPLGTSLLGVFDQLAKQFSAWAQALLTDPAFHAFVQQMIGLAPLLAQTLGSVVSLLGSLMSVLAPVAGPALQLINALASALGGALKDAGPALGEFIGVLASALAPVLRSLAPILADVVKGLAPLLIGLIRYLQPVLKVIAPLLDTIVKGFGSVFDAIAPFLPQLGALIAAFGAHLLPILQQLITAYFHVGSALAGQLLQAIVQSLPAVIQIATAFADLLPQLLPLIQLMPQLALAIIPIIPPLVQLIATMVVGLAPILKILIKLFTLSSTILITVVAAAIRGTVGIFTGLIKVSILMGSLVGAAFRNLGTVLAWVWHNVIEPAFDAFIDLLGDIPRAFSRGASAIKTAWDKVRQYTKDPINFVIGTVYNQGIRGLWNTVMGWLHLPGNLKLDKFALLEAGGTLANPAAARPMMTNGPMAIVGEGNPRYPEYVIPTDPRHRGRAQSLWASAGGDLQMLEGGGILGGILDTVKHAAGSVLSLGKQALDLITNPKAIWDKLAGPVLHQADSLAVSPFGHAAAQLPHHMLDEAWTVAKQLITSFSSGYGGGSGDGAKAVAFEKDQLGKPYQWGATGPNLFDCSGLTMRAWEKAGKEIGRTTYEQVNSGRPGSRSTALPGDLHFPEPGHVMMFVAPRSGGDQEMIHAPHTGDHVRYAGFRGGGIVRAIATALGSAGAAGGKSPSAAQAFARSQLGEFGWGAGQMDPLINLWNRESGWRWNARNPSSGAYGIPQALPATKMGSAGGDWLTNGNTQIRWGLGYVHDRYDTPSNAWAHEVHQGWYDQGGELQPGLTLAYNATGKPEKVLTDQQWDLLGRSVRGGEGDHYHAHFDGLTAATIESQVRTGIQATMVDAKRHDRTGRPR